MSNRNPSRPPAKKGALMISADVILKAKKRVEKVWGYETILVNNGHYCCKLLHLVSGRTSSVHYHRKKVETFIVLTGSCVMDRSNGGFVKRSYAKPGDWFEITPGMHHKFFVPKSTSNKTGCLILEVSTPHSDDDVVRIEPSRVL